MEEEKEKEEEVGEPAGEEEIGVSLRALEALI